MRLETACRGRFSYHLRLEIRIFVFAMIAASASAAPPFVASGRVEELRKLIVAEDSGGPVSAFDVLLYLDMARRPAVAIPAAQWLATGEKRDAGTWKSIRGAVEEYLAVRSLARGAAPAEAPDYLKRNMIYSAAEAAWIQTQIIERGEISITQTDINRYYIANPQLYSSDSRAEVRYIFLPVRDMTQPADIADAEKDLKGIREKVARGEITFGEAATRFSQAPSAAEGGLIPEFAAGTHFAEFDFQAFNIKKAGDMSPVFVGNDGVYLIQLLSKTPPHKTPMEEVRGEIEQTLRHEMVRSYYRFLYRKLESKTYSRNLAALWPYAALEAPIATLGNLKLTRDQVLRINPGVITASYEPQQSLIQSEAQRWIEGEIILRDLETKAQAGHEYIARAKSIAAELLASRSALRRTIPWASVSTRKAAMRTLGMDVGTTPGIEQSRVIEISLIPEADALRETGQGEIIRNTMRQLAETIGAGKLPTRPEETEFVQTLRAAAASGDDELRTAIKKLKEASDLSPWAGIKIQIRDLEWKDAAPVIAWHSSLVALEPGQVSAPQPVGERIHFYYCAASRLDTASEWLRTPLFLQSIAYSNVRNRAMQKEIRSVRAMKFLKMDGESAPNP